MEKSGYLNNFNSFLFATMFFITTMIVLCVANIPIASAKSHQESQGYQQEKIVSLVAYTVQTSHPVSPYDYRPNNHLENVEANKCYWLTPFQPSAGCQYQQQQNHYNVLLGKWRKSPRLSLQQKQFGVKVNL